MKAAEARAAWAELTDAQRWALRQMFAARNGITDRNAFGLKASDKRRGTMVLKSLEVLGLAQMGGWFHFPNCAISPAGRVLVRAADAEATRKIRKVLAANRRRAAREAGDG